MHEPDVTLTDYLLALECLIFAALLVRQRSGAPAPRRALIGLFLGLASAAALGGTVHGFFAAPGTAQNVLWTMTLMAIGLAAWSGWALFAASALEGRTARIVTAVAGVEFAVYAGYLLFVDQSYVIAILNYLPASLALTGLFLLRVVQSRQAAAGLGLVGLILTFMAAAVQQSGLGLHPRYFNHNALYHLIQAIGLFLFFQGGRWLAAQASLTAKAELSPAR
jgi:hypothetical protein